MYKDKTNLMASTRELLFKKGFYPQAAQASLIWGKINLSSIDLFIIKIVLTKDNLCPSTVHRDTAHNSGLTLAIFKFLFCFKKITGKEAFIGRL